MKRILIWICSRNTVVKGKQVVHYNIHIYVYLITLVDPYLLFDGIYVSYISAEASRTRV